MAERDLRKLKRAELLEMMIRQGKAVGELQEKLALAQQQQAETEAEMAQMEETFERLRKKLDQKDEEIQEQSRQMEETIERLKGKLDQKDEELRVQSEQMEETFDRLRKRLDEKDAKIRDLRNSVGQENHEIRLEEAGAIAEAALRLSRIVEDAQRTTERYQELVQGMAACQDEINGSGDT